MGDFIYMLYMLFKKQFYLKNTSHLMSNLMCFNHQIFAWSTNRRAKRHTLLTVHCCTLVYYLRKDLDSTRKKLIHEMIHFLKLILGTRIKNKP